MGRSMILINTFFLRELRELKHWVQPEWLIIGDFNMIYMDQDKNNGRLDRRMMARFRRALNHMEVKEILLLNRRFTWSNDQNLPTMTRIDRAFCTVACEEIYSEAVIQTLSTSTSDHCPLLLQPLAQVPTLPIFIFESHWPQIPGYASCVQEAWDKPIQQSLNPMMTLHVKLSRTAKALWI